MILLRPLDMGAEQSTHSTENPNETDTLLVDDKSIETVNSAVARFVFEDTGYDTDVSVDSGMSEKKFVDTDDYGSDSMGESESDDEHNSGSTKESETSATKSNWKRCEVGGKYSEYRTNEHRDTSSSTKTDGLSAGGEDNVSKEQKIKRTNKHIYMVLCNEKIVIHTTSVEAAQEAIEKLAYHSLFNSPPHKMPHLEWNSAFCVRLYEKEFCYEYIASEYRVVKAPIWEHA